MLAGALKGAGTLTPSRLPCMPAMPASVGTAPAAGVLRVGGLLGSGAEMLPRLSTFAPEGLLKRAAAPVPSAPPVWPAAPASVVTTPAETLRIVELRVSET